jgi:hypothetical protein
VSAALRLRGFLQPLLETQNRAAIEEAVREAEAQGTRNQPLAAGTGRD